MRLTLFPAIGTLLLATCSNVEAYSERAPGTKLGSYYKTESRLKCFSLFTPRRELFATGLLFSTAAAAASARAASDVEPLADLPMIRLRLPKDGFGREYVALKLKVQGKGPFDFMVDTGLTTEFITPHLRQVLGLKEGGSRIKGVAAGGLGTSNSIIELKDVALCCGNIQNMDELPLPTLHAVITDFPQEHIDPAHDPVEGMLGMEALSLFDVDFDFPKSRIRLWKPGTAAKAALAAGMVEIPAVVINETGLIGMRLASTLSGQPVLGFLDCGSTFSVINWQAAGILGFPKRDDPVYKKNAALLAVGVDGRPIQLPTVEEELSFTGDVLRDPSSGRVIGFTPPPPGWKPWNPVQLAIGDLPAFQTILGDGINPYKGPAALIGLDVLSQRRIILETGEGRKRRIFVSPR